MPEDKEKFLKPNLHRIRRIRFWHVFLLHLVWLIQLVLAWEIYLNIRQYIHKGGTPELIEADVFRIHIPITQIAVEEYVEKTELTEREKQIVSLIEENNQLTVEEVMDALKISRATVFRDYAKIRKKCGAVYDKKTGEWYLPVSSEKWDCETLAC